MLLKPNRDRQSQKDDWKLSDSYPLPHLEHELKETYAQNRTATSTVTAGTFGELAFFYFLFAQAGSCSSEISKDSMDFPSSAVL